MNAFVPPGYLSFDDAIDRVAEIITLAREPARPAAHDDTDPVPLRPGIAGVISAKEAAMIEQRRLAKEVLQKLLYTEQIPSVVIKEDGSCHPTPGYIWGGEQWNEALWYNRITFSDRRYVSAYISGRPLILRDDLEEAFNTVGTGKAETDRRDAEIYSLFKTTSTANPQAKRGRIYDIMRRKRPDLFTNRREAATNTQISDQRISRIIREQQR